MDTILVRIIIELNPNSNLDLIDDSLYNENKIQTSFLSYAQ